MVGRLPILASAGLIAVGAVVFFAARTGGGDDGPGPKGAAAVVCDAVALPDQPADAFVASLDPGDTGCFRDGTHAADEVIELDAPGVTLTSYPGERATLAGRLVITREADEAKIENLALDGSTGDGPSPTVNANDVVFRGNDVTNGHRGICFVLGDDQYGEAAGTLIENNRIHDCGRLPATNHDHGIYVAHASGTVIRDNLIYGNADRGIQLYPDADDSLVTGNVIDGNGQGLIISGGSDSASENNLIENNLITNSTIRFNIESHWQGPVGNGNIARDNCLWTTNSGYEGAPADSGIEPEMAGAEASDNVVADPLYVDRSAGDFELQQDSPCATLGG